MQSWNESNTRRSQAFDTKQQKEEDGGNTTRKPKQRGEKEGQTGGEKLQSRGIVRDEPEWFKQVNESKVIGRAKNQIEDPY